MSGLLPSAYGYLEQLYTFSDLNRDPRGRVISMAYLDILPWEAVRESVLDGDASLVCFAASLGEKGLRLKGADGTLLSGSDLAFDHGRIIETGIRRLRGKIDYTEIGFRFLADMNAFSLSELQDVFGRRSCPSGAGPAARPCFTAWQRAVEMNDRIAFSTKRFYERRNIDGIHFSAGGRP